MVRPNDRLTKKGDWVQSTFPKLHRTNELVAQINGSWYYMGTFAAEKTESVSYEEWAAFPEAVSIDFVVCGQNLRSRLDAGGGSQLQRSSQDTATVRRLAEGRKNSCEQVRRPTSRLQ